jgi:hypothetical protein
MDMAKPSAPFQKKEARAVAYFLLCQCACISLNCFFVLTLTFAFAYCCALPGLEQRVDFVFAAIEAKLRSGADSISLGHLVLRIKSRQGDSNPTKEAGKHMPLNTIFGSTVN